MNDDEGDPEPRGWMEEAEEEYMDSQIHAEQLAEAMAEYFPRYPIDRQQIWLRYWGKSISLADLILAGPGGLPTGDSYRAQDLCGLCPIAGAELKPFFPTPQDLGLPPAISTCLPQVWQLGFGLIEVAKARRHAHFDGYPNAQRPQPPARLGQQMRQRPDAVGAHTVSLPHDLLLFSVVLTCLPLPDVFRARTVCRFWNQFLSSPLHLRRLTDNPDFDRPRLVIQSSTSSHASCLAIFDRDHWYSNPVPLPDFCLRAAAGGLFCFSFETASGCWEDGVLLLVGNPITKQWRRLPPSPQTMRSRWTSCRSVACTMWADRFRGYYKIFVLSGALWMYDSSLDQWIELKRSLPHSVGTCRKYCGITPSGLLHYLDANGKIVAFYDVASRSLSDVKTHGPSNMDPSQLQDPFSRLPVLVHCDGAVFVVARMKANVRMSGRLPWITHGLVAIWELDAVAFGDTGKWGWPVSVAPQDLLKGAIEGSDGTDFCVTTDGEKAIYLVLPGGATMLVYDVASKVWSSFPGCPSSFFISFHPQPYYVPLLWPGPI